MILGSNQVVQDLMKMNISWKSINIYYHLLFKKINLKIFNNCQKYINKIQTTVNFEQ